MKRVLVDVTPADVSRLDAVGIIGLIEPIVNYEVPPGHRLRMRIEVEPIDARPRDDRALETARELMRSNLCRLGAGAAGYLPVELDDLAASIENLISARVARALRIHCDADHDEDC